MIVRTFFALFCVVDRGYVFCGNSFNDSKTLG